MGMEDDPGATHGRPSDRLGIPEPLVADRHAELDAIDLEEPAFIPRHVEAIFGRVELVLRLVSEHLPPGVDHAGGDLPPLRRDPLDPEDGRD